MIIRYASRGPHHRVSGHFALGKHAVERLNETNLNTNEVFINQLPEHHHAPSQPQQQQAQATFPAAQVIYNTKSPMIVDQKAPLNNIYAPNQPHHQHQQQQQQIFFQTPPSSAHFNHQQIPLLRNQEKHSLQPIFQHAQQMIPLIYQYAQQPQQFNYFYQPKPQEVIYHQQPIASMASFVPSPPSPNNEVYPQQQHQHQQLEQQQHQTQQQPQFIFIDESQSLLPQAQPEAANSNGGNINVELAQEEIHLREEISPQQLNGVNGDLIQVQLSQAPNNVASDNQNQAKLQKDISDEAAQLQEMLFQSPIVVGEQQQQQQQFNFLPNSQNDTVIVQQKPLGNQQSLVLQNYQPPQKQINLQILTDVNAKQATDQFLEASKLVNGHTNHNSFQYLVADQDQDRLDSTMQSQTEAPSRQFLKKFKNFRIESSTSSESFSTSTSRTVSISEGGNECCKDNSSAGCCKNKSEVKVLEITQRPIAISFQQLAPVHVGVSLTNEKLDDCIDGHSVTPTVQKNINVILQETKPQNFGDRIVVSSTPAPVTEYTTPKSVVTKPIFFEKPTFTERPRQIDVVHKPNIAVQRPPIFIQKPSYVPVQRQQLLPVQHKAVLFERQHHTEVIHKPIFIEKQVIKEVQVPVEKSIYIQSPPKIIEHYVKSPPETRIVERIVHQPVEVQKIVEKIVDRPVYVQSPPETKVVHQQVIVEKPVIKEVQVPVEKTVFIPSPPETKIVHQPIIKTIEKPVYIDRIVQQPYEVEKIVEKIVDRPIIQTVEKPVYIEKFIDRPVEKIVEKPVIQTVEKFIDRPVTVEKYIDRPYPVEKYIDRPVPYAVNVPYEKPVFVKPDFHIIAKSIPYKHKLFDFDSLFGFLSKKKEVKHIFVPSGHQHQLKQLGHHQLIQSTLTTIDPIKESPVLDYTNFGTTHLNPIKPIYGVPSTPLAPVNNGYNYPNPYAGKLT